MESWEEGSGIKDRGVPDGAAAGGWWLGAPDGAGSRIEDRDRDRDRRAPPSNVIRGRSADNRKAPLNFSFPLEGKCHVVAKGCTRVSIPMKLTIVLLGPTSADLETLCRGSTPIRKPGEKQECPLTTLLQTISREPIFFSSSIIM